MSGVALLRDEAAAAADRRDPLAGRSSSDRVGELIRRLRAAVHKKRDRVRRQDGIIRAQRRQYANVKATCLAQSREIVQLRDRLAEHHLPTEVKL